jgi:FlaG/FlaF family flagellin (archaellin)
LTLVLWLIAIATLLFFFAGIGFVAARINDAMAVSVVFGHVLYVAAGITMAALLVALVVGVYHLYLYMFTDKRPLSLFATTNKSDD